MNRLYCAVCHMCNEAGFCEQEFVRVEIVKRCPQERIRKAIRSGNEIHRHQGRRDAAGDHLLDVQKGLRRV